MQHSAHPLVQILQCQFELCNSVLYPFSIFSTFILAIPFFPCSKNWTNSAFLCENTQNYAAFLKLRDRVLMIVGSISHFHQIVSPYQMYEWSVRGKYIWHSATCRVICMMWDCFFSIFYALVLQYMQIPCYCPIQC